MKHLLINYSSSVWGRRLGRNPPSVLGDIHLIGIPAPRAGVHRRLLSLSRRGRVVSPFPPAQSTQPHHPQPAEVSFCALTRLLSRHLSVPRARYVDGVSSNPSVIGFGVARQLANPTLSSLKPVNKVCGRVGITLPKIRCNRGRIVGLHLILLGRVAAP